jgi:hypothetical protein
MIRLFLDPGSRPALRDLAGMTNCATAPQGEKKSFTELSVWAFTENVPKIVSKLDETW